MARRRGSRPSTAAPPARCRRSRTKRTPSRSCSIGEQLFGAHRLRQVVDAAGLSRGRAGVAERAGRDGDDGNVARSPHPRVSRRVASSPSRSAIFKSMKITWGRCLRASAMASWPPAAVITRTPALSSSVARIRRLTVLSSATSAITSSPSASRASSGGAASVRVPRQRCPTRPAPGRGRSRSGCLRPAGSPPCSSPPILPMRCWLMVEAQARAAGRGARLGLGEGLENLARAPRARCRCRCRSPRTAAARRRPSRSSSCTSPLGGELDGVAQQVQQHLAQVPAVEHDARGACRARSSCPAAGPCAAPPRPPGTRGR